MSGEHADVVVDIVTEAASVTSLDRLSLLLRHLKRREARRSGGRELTHRQIAARAGWSPVSVTYYLSGAVLPPIDRFDSLVRLLGASPAEHAALVAARDRVEEQRRGRDGPARGVTDTAAVVTPRSLPAPPSAFIGRVAQLSELDQALVDQSEIGAIAVVTGMGGVGKTALALHWAHRSVDRFPDGQLYVNLRGFDPHEPLSTAEALRQLLVALGSAPTDVPRRFEERIERYRALLAGRRMLVMLDNAVGAEQVRPLLPPAPCVALVTSRDRLDELVAAGARRVDLDVLTDEEAATLLRTLVGARCDGEPDAVRSLIVLCGHLPLALRMVAEQVNSRPAMALAEQVAQLANARAVAELDAFECGDARSNLRAVFSWSLRAVPRRVTQAFVMLGLAPGDTFDAYVLAALLDVPVQRARVLLGTLIQVHLAEVVGEGRYSLHGMVRAYAASLAERELPPSDRRAATHRLLDYYLASAAAAVEKQFPGRTSRPRCYPAPTRTVALPDLSTAELAAAWLATERIALVRLAVAAVPAGFPAHTVALALVLRAFVESADDSLTLQTAALAATQALGDDCEPVDRAGVHTCLGVGQLRLGRISEAEVHLERAVAEHVAADDPAGAVLSLSTLGTLRGLQGRMHENLGCQRQALEIARTSRSPVHEVVQLFNIGAVQIQLGQYEEAAPLCQQAIGILVGLSAANQLATTLTSLHHALIDPHYTALVRHLAASPVEPTDLAYLTHVRYALGQLHRRLIRMVGPLDRSPLGAPLLLDDALLLARQIGRQGLIAKILNTLGELHLGAGDATAARDSHTEALWFANRDGDCLQAARARLGLGDAYARQHELVAAREQWLQALNAYGDMGLSTADSVRARLAALA